MRFLYGVYNFPLLPIVVLMSSLWGLNLFLLLELHTLKFSPSGRTLTAVFIPIWQWHYKLPFGNPGQDMAKFQHPSLLHHAEYCICDKCDGVVRVANLWTPTLYVLKEEYQWVTAVPFTAIGVPVPPPPPPHLLRLQLGWRAQGVQIRGFSQMSQCCISLFVGHFYGQAFTASPLYL